LSQINTNGIDVNYPNPGRNNSTQGFRDNFAQIKNNLDTTAEELTDLQSKVILKAALNDSVLDNNMANTQISNVSTRGFRGTTYNLGNALSGIVTIDVNKADLHYGTVTGNVTLRFNNWAPTNTVSNVALRLNIANVDAVVSLPSQVVSANNNFGTTLLENFQVVGNVATITRPADSEIVEYTFSTIDCGNSVTVSPNNRPYQATQIITKTPPPTGVPGDKQGSVAVDDNYIYVCTGDFDGIVYDRVVGNTFDTGNIVQLNSTTSLTTDSPIIFSGNTDSANTNILPNTVYYIKNITGANITISATRVSGTAGSEVNVGTKANASISASIIEATDIWKRTEIVSW